MKHPTRGVRFLWPLSLAYSVIARTKAWCYARGIFRARRLPGTVISVGNLTVGGTGKTPVVLAIAERLAREGKHAAILTRGYRGTVEGGSGGVPQSDEVAMLRERLAGKVQLGVGPNRFRSGTVLARHGVEWFVLDDGFQHLKLARDADIVRVDASDRFGGGRVLPAGPFARNAPGASARGYSGGHARSVSGTFSRRRIHSPSPPHQQSHFLRRHASRQRPASSRAGRLSSAGQRLDTKARFLAFCGDRLNPPAFFGELARLGISDCRAARGFADHHVCYTARDAAEIEKSAANCGADALLCTEKDVWNLRNVQFAALPVYCCRISLDLPEAFWNAVEETVRRRKADETK